MTIHDSTAIEIWFEEVENGEVGAGCYVHEALLVRDEGVGAIGFGAHVLCAIAFAV